MANNKLSAEKTFDYQSQKESLPLPTLVQSCAKYLEAVKPFLSKEEFFYTEMQVNLFQNGIGKEFHNKLEEHARNSRNWLQDWWFDMYLNYRGPLPVVSNTAGGVESLTPFDQPKLGVQYQRASVWIYYMAKLYLNIIHQKLPVQRQQKKHPFDMSQYCYLFCGGRIPGEKFDTPVNFIHLLPTKDGKAEVVANSKHIVVLMRGRIFTVKIFDSSGTLLTPPNIERQLLLIRDECEKLDDGVSIGSLTSDDRNTWYKAYKHLCQLDRQNKININIINEAICAFAFDDIKTYNLQDSCEHAILGDCVNRWFDKSCTAIVSSTGIIGTNSDHLHLDGNVGTTMLQIIHDNVQKCQYRWQGDASLQIMEQPLELQFIVDNFILNAIKESQRKHRRFVALLDVIDKPVPGYGKSYAKSVGVHPDSLVQMAIQLGYYALHRKVASTYESATTRMFRSGRTETSRSCTCESKEWVDAMFDANSNRETRKRLFRQAAAKHIKTLGEACDAKGFDRHFYVLQRMIEKEGQPTPGIFADKAWKLSGGDGNFVISSSLAGFFQLHGGMAPMIHHGYGAFYTIEPHRFNLNVSAWKTSDQTMYRELYDSIVEALHTIHELLLDHSKL